MINFEITGNACGVLDPEVLRHAAASVFHYFRSELERETVTVGEFAAALEKVLRHLGFTIRAGGIETDPRETGETDLGRLARESADSLELFFYPRLRDELRAQLRQSPRLVRFSRIARLRQAACRRAPLEFPMRTIAGPDRRVFARLPDRRTGAERVRAGGGMKLDSNFAN